MTWPTSDYLRARAFVVRRWPDIADDIDVCAVLDAARASWYPDLGCRWGPWWRWALHDAVKRHLAREQTRARTLDRLALQPGPEHGPTPDEQVNAVQIWLTALRKLRETAKIGEDLTPAR